MEKADWHVLTVTRGGTVSLLKNLTTEAARQTMQRLTSMMPFSRGDPWSERNMADRARSAAEAELRSGSEGWTRASVGGGFYHSSDGDLVRVECFGAEGAALEVWPKPADYDERYAAALALAREALLAA